MENKQRQEILEKAKNFFSEKIVDSHIKNTKKLIKRSKFNVNPFLEHYLANFLTGNSNPESIAKALIYARVLGASINTTFGTQLQYFCSSVLDGFSSTTSGIDIEFIDQVDGRKKYCQIKAGPNTINKDDIKTIIGHFTAVKNLARANNNLQISLNDLIVGVFYGNPKELSRHYKKINQEHPVYIGKEFWYRLTGEKDFYLNLIQAFGEVAIKSDGVELLAETVQNLAEDIKKQYK